MHLAVTSEYMTHSPFRFSLRLGRFHRLVRKDRLKSLSSIPRCTAAAAISASDTQMAPGSPLQQRPHPRHEKFKPSDHHGFVGPTEHGFFQFVVPAVSLLCEPQLVVIVDAGPGIPEVGDPGNAGFLFQLQGDQVHAVGRSGGDDCIDGMVPEVSREVADRGAYPEFPGIGDEEVSADPYRQPLFPSGPLFFRKKV